MATHSRIPAWEILWTEEPGGLQSMRSQRVRHDWVTNTHPRTTTTRHRCWGSELGAPSASGSASLLPCGWAQSPAQERPHLRGSWRAPESLSSATHTNFSVQRQRAVCAFKQQRKPHAHMRRCREAPRGACLQGPGAHSARRCPPCFLWGLERMFALQSFFLVVQRNHRQKPHM